MKLPHSIFMHHKTDEIPHTFRAMSKIIFSCIYINTFINNKLEKMNLKRKAAGLLNFDLHLYLNSLYEI